MMKKTFTLLSLFLSLSIAKADYWTQKADLTGGIRYVAVGFSIGSKGYIGTGYGTTFMQDFWEYDPAANTWTQKANYPGAARYFACGLSIGSKGYIGLGQDPGGYLQDFWAYDPAANSWTQIADFGGGARGFQPTAFSVDGYGYVGLGYDGTDRQDLWQYDTLLNTWIQKANFPGTGMEQSTSFTIGQKAYMGTGETSMPMFPHNDFWEYNPSTDSWTQLANFPGSARFSASSFSIGTSGYIGNGYDSANVQHTDFYQYDPFANSWTQKADVGGMARSHALGFAIGSKGYIGTGYSAAGFLNDFWEYTPDSTTSMEETTSATGGLQFTISPNPAKEFIVISSEFSIREKIDITITDVHGKKVFGTQLQTKTLNFKLQTSNFSKGIYFVEASNACLPDWQGKEKMVKKFMKE